MDARVRGSAGAWLGDEEPLAALAPGNRRLRFRRTLGSDHPPRHLGGQKLYIVPQYDLVAVFTGGAYNSGGSPPNRIMVREILPRLIAEER